MIRFDDQHLVVVGGSSGIGLATARRARADGADVIITARDPGRVHRAGRELEASIAAFDATDFDRLASFLGQLPSPIDHVLVTGPAPNDVPLTSLEVDAARREVEAHLLLPLQLVARAGRVVRCGGSVICLGCTGAGSSTARSTLVVALTAALSSITSELAAELAPVRVNLVVSGCADDPSEVAALVVRLMSDAVVTGETRVVGSASPEGGRSHSG